MTDELPPLRPAVAFVAIGIVVLLGAIGFATWRSVGIARLERADGVVIAHFRRGRGGERYVVEVLPRGHATPVRAESSVGGVMVYGVGATVGVYYDPIDPSEALIDSGPELWFVPIVTGGAAACCWLPTTVLWLVTVVAIRRRRARKKS